MKTIKVIKVSMLSILLGGSLMAKECHNLSNIDIQWTSFKTLEKIGVSGDFFKYNLQTQKNLPSIIKALEASSVKLDLKDLDAKADIKTNNIQSYFVKHLFSTKVDAKIKKAYNTSLILEITMNGVKRDIPFNYKLVGNKLNAKGYFDAGDFVMDKVMHILATGVAGHMNKGWDDIPVSFELDYSKKCK